MGLNEALKVFNLELKDMKKIDMKLARQVLKSEKRTLATTKCLSVKENSMRNIAALEIILGM